MNWIKDQATALLIKVRGWRTLFVNALLGTPMILDLLGTIDIGALFGDKAKTVYAIGLVVLNIYLRIITTTPVGQKSAG